jgi:hypothetical protein
MLEALLLHSILTFSLPHSMGDEAVKAKRNLEELGADKIWMYSELNDKAKLSELQNDLDKVRASFLLRRAV